MKTEKTDSERPLEIFPEIDTENLMPDKEHAFHPDDQEITQFVTVQSESFNHFLVREFDRSISEPLDENILVDIV
jgi:hypothetical protein